MNHIEDKPPTRMRILVVLFAVVALLQIVVGLAVYSSFGEWSERAQFGDMFGAASTLFSGLAFAGVIYAIFLQREELFLQRKELILTRNELERTAGAQERSSEMLAKQLRAMHGAEQAQAAFVLFQRLQEKDVRAGRSAAVELCQKENWTDSERELVSRACNEFDIAGIMARYEFVREEFIIDNWGEGIKELWPGGQRLICMERARRHIDLYPDFERLYRNALAFTGKRQELATRRQRMCDELATPGSAASSAAARG